MAELALNNNHSLTHKYNWNNTAYLALNKKQSITVSFKTISFLTC